jgi:hypothetical protein
MSLQGLLQGELYLFFFVITNVLFRSLSKEHTQNNRLLCPATRSRYYVPFLDPRANTVLVHVVLRASSATPPNANIKISMENWEDSDQLLSYADNLPTNYTFHFPTLHPLSNLLYQQEERGLSVNLPGHSSASHCSSLSVCLVSTLYPMLKTISSMMKVSREKARAAQDVKTSPHFTAPVGPLLCSEQRTFYLILSQLNPLPIFTSRLVLSFNFCLFLARDTFLATQATSPLSPCVRSTRLRVPRDTR